MLIVPCRVCTTVQSIPTSVKLPSASGLIPFIDTIGVPSIYLSCYMACYSDTAELPAVI